MLGKFSRNGFRIDLPINDENFDSRQSDDLSAKLDNHLGKTRVRWLVVEVNGMTRFNMGHDRLRSGHNSSQHGDFAFVHRKPTPKRNHVTIDETDVASVLIC